MSTQLEKINSLLNSREIQKAEVLIAKLLRTDPPSESRAELLLRRARARLIGQQPDDALEDIHTAAELIPHIDETPSVQCLKADILFARFELSPVGFTDRADADRALKLYECILDTVPEFGNIGWVWYQKGRVLLSADRVDAAIDCLQHALLHPSQVTALTALCYERLGFIYLFERRDPAAALSFLDRAAVTYPPSEPETWLAQLHILRSRALRDQGQHDAALSAAEQALQIMERLGPEMRGGQQDAHLALAEIYAEMPGRQANAASHFQQFLQLSRKPLGVDVTWSRVNERLGDMLFDLERYEGAIEAYNNALAYNPYHPWETVLYYQMARCYYRLHMYDKTIASIQQMQQAAAEEDEQLQDYRAFHLLGNAYFALEQYPEAVAAYQQANALAPAQADDLDKINTYLRMALELSDRVR